MNNLSKKQYEDLISKTPVGIFLLRTTPTGEISFDYLSTKMAEMLNTSAENIQQNNQLAFEAIHPDELDTFVKLIRDSIQQRQTFNWEGRFLNDNRVIWVHITASPDSQENGDILWNGIAADITERKQMEEQMRDLNRDFISYLENTHDFIYFKDKNSRYRFCSQSVAKISGHESWRDIIGKHTLEVFPNGTGQVYVEEEFLIYDEGKSILDKTDPYYDSLGNLQWVSTNKWPLFDQEGKVVGLFGISRDITALKQAQEAQRIAAAAFESQEGIVITDANKIVMRINHGFSKITGYTTEEVIGQNMRFLKSNRHSADFYTTMWDKIHKDGAWQGEIWNRIKNGEVHPHLLSISAIKDSNDVCTHYVGTYIDITERKQTEDEIYKWTSIFKNANWGVAATSSKGMKFELMNETFAQMHGFEVKELIGRSVLEVYAPEVRAGLSGKFIILRETGHLIFESIHIRKDGSTFPVVVDATIVKDEFGKPLFRAVNVQDITERKKTEEALQESEQRFRNFFEKNSSVMMLIDPTSGEIIEVNSVAAAYYGYPSELMAGMPITNINILPQEILANDRLLAVREERNHFNFQHRLASGELRDVEVHLTPIESSGRSLLFSIVFDITERRQLEAKLKEISIRDPLTNAFNRRYIFERLNGLFSEYLRDNNIFTVLIIDLDHFKSVNDSYGHQAGDFILVEFTKTIKSHLRPYDLFGRYGGEEFIVIFINARKDQILGKINFLSDIIRNTTYKFKDTEINITFSGGISDSSEYDDENISVEKIIEVADNRLYEAKNSGRDKVLS
jgi:diguanylate cyclase (GGDEF)-like protein/PAS domain S-box-containing protein